MFIFDISIVDVLDCWFLFMLSFLLVFWCFSLYFIKASFMGLGFVFWSNVKYLLDLKLFNFELCGIKILLFISFLLLYKLFCILSIFFNIYLYFFKFNFLNFEFIIIKVLIQSINFILL